MKQMLWRMEINLRLKKNLMLYTKGNYRMKMILR